MKRFYKTAAVEAADDGHAITLDGRPVKTPAKAPLVVPSARLADIIAGEWDAQGEQVDPTSMPLMRLAATTIDRIAPQREGVVAETAKYAETDLICYGVADPQGLRERQQAAWQPLHAFVRRRFDVNLVETTGLMHTPQPDSAVTTLRAALDALEPFRLTGVADATGISGSLVIALALHEGEIDAEAAYTASLVDEIYQAEEWGEDDLAIERRETIRADLVVAERFLRALDIG
ncbi:MAG: ATPase [Alphaproteobacteria bacterium]|nr:ATPase [Alphaproteobacteria bacterium]